MRFIPLVSLRSYVLPFNSLIFDILRRCKCHSLSAQPVPTLLPEIKSALCANRQVAHNSVIISASVPTSQPPIDNISHALDKSCPTASPLRTLIPRLMRRNLLPIAMLCDALVVEELDVDILAGTPSMTYNDILVRPSRRQISIRGSPLTQACLISIDH